MGSSAKRKSDKKKDFQKPKLKVGKARPKASNVTDTSFRSKGIVLKEQSISEVAPSSDHQLSRHVSQLNSHSDTQRRDSLKHISNVISSRPVGSSLQIASGVLLPKLLPLIVNGGDSVRDQLVKTLRAFRPEEIRSHAEQILLFVRAGMTHLAVSYQLSAMDMLAWALDSVGEDLVSCPGGWIKTLKYFCAMLGWPLDGAQKTSNSITPVGKQGGTKLLSKTLTNLGQYLRSGLMDPDGPNLTKSHGYFPLRSAEDYRRPNHPSPFAYLNLFGQQRDDDAQMYTETEDRRQALQRHLLEPILRGLGELKKHGGEIGRVAAGSEQILLGGMTDPESADPNQ